MPRLYTNGSSFVHRMADNTGEAGPYRTECSDRKFIDVVGAKGRQTCPVQCGKCKHCRWSRRQSVANSVAMEIEASDWALWMTLTIAPSDEHDYAERVEKTLMQRFQALITVHRHRKNFSFEGRNCTSWRYVQVGEYGKEKGRAHYHALIFGKGDKPHFADHVDPKANIHIQEWPWGYVNINDQVDGGVAYYLAKYMQKGGDGRQTWKSSSNRYAIGAEWIIKKAHGLAKIAAVPTMNWIMSMPHREKRRKALLRGAKRRVLVTEFCRAKGCSLLSLATASSEALWPSLVRFEADRRIKEKRVPVGYVLTRLGIKAKVLSELRAILGIEETNEVKYGRKARPADWQPQYSFIEAGGDDGFKTFDTRVEAGEIGPDQPGNDDAADAWERFGRACADAAIAINRKRDRKDDPGYQPA